MTIKKTTPTFKIRQKTVKDDVFLSMFSETKSNQVLLFFLRNRILDYSMQDILDEPKLDVTRSTATKIIDELLVNKILLHTRKIGNTVYYKLNKKNPNVPLLVQLYDNIQ